MALVNRNGFVSDAEGCGKIALEVILKRKPKAWMHLGDDEGDFIKWVSRWALHWAAYALKFNGPVV